VVLEGKPSLNYEIEERRTQSNLWMVFM